MEIKLTAEEFKNLYLNNELDDLSKQLGVSVNTLVEQAKKLNISKPRGRAKNKLIVE